VSGKNREGEYKRTIVKVSTLITDIRTGGHSYPRDKSIGNLFAGWAVSGIEIWCGRGAFSVGAMEPGELRGSRWALRAAEGAGPSADSPQLAISPEFH